MTVNGERVYGDQFTAFSLITDDDSFLFIRSFSAPGVTNVHAAEAISWLLVGCIKPRDVTSSTGSSDAR